MAYAQLVLSGNVFDLSALSQFFLPILVNLQELLVDATWTLN
jgi:hypothetical protein